MAARHGASKLAGSAIDFYRNLQSRLGHGAITGELDTPRNLCVCALCMALAYFLTRFAIAFAQFRHTNMAPVSVKVI
jgi:hypothetical protein